jgi:hypothetical protein
MRDGKREREDTEMTGLTRAAELAGVRVDPSTLRRAAQSRKLAAKKIGRDWLTTPAAVKAWHENEEYHRFSPKKYR